MVACLWWISAWQGHDGGVFFFLQSPSSSQSSLFLVRGLHQSWVGFMVWFGHGGGLGLAWIGASMVGLMVDQCGSVDGGFDKGLNQSFDGSNSDFFKWIWPWVDVFFFFLFSFWCLTDYELLVAEVSSVCSAAVVDLYCKWRWLWDILFYRVEILF